MIFQAGAGNLQLGGVNTFGLAGTTGVDFQAGGLILNTAAALGVGWKVDPSRLILGGAVAGWALSRWGG